jgi:hypothetical protein
MATSAWPSSWCGDHAPLLLAQHAVALLQAGDQALDRLVEVGLRHRVRAAPRGEQCGLVDQVGEIGAREPGRDCGDPLEVDAGRELHLLRVHLQDLQASFLVRPVDQHHAVEAPGAQQRRVEDLGPVGGGEQHQPGARIEAVELDQQLVQRLLLLVVAAVAARAACAPERVELVDEDDRRRLLARLLEQIAHPRRAHADEHLDELRAGDREEGHAGLAGDRAREQRLAGSRRADQQHALGNARAEPPVALRVLEELDHLLQLGLGFVHAGHVAERDAGLLLDVHLGAALADAHEAAARPPCWPAMRRTSRYQTPKKTSAGTIQERMSRRKVLSCTCV